MKQLFFLMQCLEEEVETNDSRKCLSSKKKKNVDINLDRTSLLGSISSQAASLEFMRVRCFFLAATANNDDRVATESHIDPGFVKTKVDFFSFANCE